MLWVLFSILMTLSDTAKDTLRKKNVRHVDAYIISFAGAAFVTMLLLPALFFMKIPPLGKEFWIALLVAGLSRTVSSVLNIKALETTDLSLAAPISALTPVFLLLTSPLIVGEFPSRVGVAGVLLSVAGLYILKAREKRKGLFEPFKALFKEKGIRYIFIATALVSVTTPFDKLGAQQTSAFFWIIAMMGFVALSTLPLVLVYFESPVRQMKENILWLGLLGLASFGVLLFQMIAIGMTLVVNVISVKRTSALFSVLSGHYFFKEKNVKERFLGAAVVLLGLILILWSEV